MWFLFLQPPPQQRKRKISRWGFLWAKQLSAIPSASSWKQRQRSAAVFQGLRFIVHDIYIYLLTYFIQGRKKCLFKYLKRIWQQSAHSNIKATAFMTRRRRASAVVIQIKGCLSSEVRALVIESSGNRINQVIGSTNPPHLPPQLMEHGVVQETTDLRNLIKSLQTQFVRC